MGWLLLALLVAGAVWVRLAPADPDRWHVNPVSAAPPDGSLRRARGAARVSLVLPEPPAQALARLDAIAQATPRTRRLAGSPGAGLVTWETRSLVWGFPDYTSAAATPAPGGARLDLYARQRFGRFDWGVNAARLQDWIARLSP